MCIFMRSLVNIDNLYDYMYMYVHTPELNVVEVAHDHQVQVKNYITEDLKLLNSYDTWHGNYGCLYDNIMCKHLHNYAGTKNVAKQMKKVSTGTKKNLGKSWFHELSDKRMFLVKLM